MTKLKLGNQKFSEVGRVALYNMGEHGAIYSDTFVNQLKQDHPYYVIQMDEINSEHHELEQLRSVDDLNNYYAFATFMPPGDNKVIVTFKNLFSKESYNYCKFVVPIRKEEVSSGSCKPICKLINRLYCMRNASRKS